MTAIESRSPSGQLQDRSLVAGEFPASSDAGRTRLEFTVLIPTRNESKNIEPLLARLVDAMGERPAEVLFVDDSSDDTPHVIRQLASEVGVSVRLIHRPVGERAGGLGGAVLEGLRAARGEWVVVMDGDLQHPPELAVRLVDVGRSRRVDLVAGSRHAPTGGSDGLDGPLRHTVSGAAGAVAKAVFPLRLARLSDPMSGLFAVRLDALSLDGLRPKGFKILLEIAVRHPKLSVAEVPFIFAVRHSGESKASLREGGRFLQQLAALRSSVFRQQVKKSRSASPRERALRLLLFGLVGLTGLAVNTAVLWLLTRNDSGPHYLWAAVVATEVSTTWNFLFTEAIVFRGVKPGSALTRAAKFYLVNHVALGLRLPLLAGLVALLGEDRLLVSNVITLVILFLARFLIADSAIYAQPDGDIAHERQPMRIIVDLADESSARPAPPETFKPGKKYLPYRYEIDGMCTIGSQVPLKELEYFRAQWLSNDVDIAIRIDEVGRSARARATMTQFTSPPALSYGEHFGRLGANFTVDIGDQVNVVASPTLGRSPHVLYTNVIEALLRFVTVSRGRILLHSACMEIDGRGFLLSARTDTGKTGTVLRLLREKGGLFLSDDMTIIDEDGVARCFPKPLTISHHTLRAVQAGDLTKSEWRRLKIQSRLHSKEGRNWGMLLAQLNVPIMGINSLTQRIVPPPKYAVDRLVDCDIARQTIVRDLFVIERGPHDLADLDFEDTIDTLVTNTDDAYGFPPFAQMAPSIVIGDAAYDELRSMERDILVKAMAKIRSRRLATPDYTWADRIPDLLAESQGASPSTVLTPFTG